MERTLYAYTYLRQPFDEVARLLAEDPETFLQAATDEAASHAREFESELRVALGRFDVGREIAIEVGEFRPSAMQAVSLPLRWSAAEHESLFPSMQAVLELQVRLESAVRARQAQLEQFEAHRAALRPPSRPCHAPRPRPPAPPPAHPQGR